MRLEPATLSDQAGHKRLLVFAPHPDDEVFGCGGLLAKQEAAEAFMIVLLTDGAKGGVFNAHDDPVGISPGRITARPESTWHMGAMRASCLGLSRPSTDAWPRPGQSHAPVHARL